MSGYFEKYGYYQNGARANASPEEIERVFRNYMGIALSQMAYRCEGEKEETLHREVKKWEKYM